ncbi:hypothetical protein J1614_007180 [Plenodomus biglobosus]|nr:hypothetical protein J1614_007180 [Plenodomus biglobosus]
MGRLSSQPKERPAAHTHQLYMNKANLTVSEAIYELTKRHAALRSTIAILKGKPHVREHSPSAAVPVIRLLITSDEAAPKQPHQALYEGFDLENELSVRWYIVQQKTGKLIYLVSHHIAIDGGSLAQLSTELFDVLDGKAHSPSQTSEKFSQAHVVEPAHGYASFPMVKIATARPSELSPSPHVDNAFQRCMLRFSIHPYMRFAADISQELQALSSRFSTSWFRVSVSLVGLLLHIHSGATLDSNHVLSVSFGGRPKGFENTIGQFANPLPVKTPTREHFLSEPGSLNNTLASLIKSVSRNISQVKKAERLSMLDLARRWRTKDGLGQFHTPQVAISLAPALPEKRCRLFPVEGRWDLFFVFQDDPCGVELGVFNEKTMEKMQSTYRALLELCSRDGPVLLNELPTMPKYLSLPPVQTPEDFPSSCADS